MVYNFLKRLSIMLTGGEPAEAVAEAAEVVAQAESEEIQEEMGTLGDCGICLEENIKPVRMPCCWKKDSTINYCARCLEIVCELGEGTGKCPTCNRPFSFDAATGKVCNTVKKGRCAMCCQSRVLVASAPGRGNRNEPRFCEKCSEGIQNTYAYECQRCGKSQKIPHPMYTYQRTPTEFTSATWACHQRCDDYTTWRIINPDEVPDRKAPESWGRTQNMLERVRTIRERERAAQN